MIGVSYLVNYKKGLSTTIVMFFHEIPHEVSDFILLHELKFSLLQIVGVQLMTGFGSLIGALVGYYLGQFWQLEALAFTTGAFMYLGINGVLTELKGV